MTHVICRLTAKNRDQLRYPTFGSRVGPTGYLYLFILRHARSCPQSISSRGAAAVRPLATSTVAACLPLCRRYRYQLKRAPYDAGVRVSSRYRHSPSLSSKLFGQSLAFNRERSCCRYSAGFPGWPFPMLKYKYIFRIKCAESILSNSTRKL